MTIDRLTGAVLRHRRAVIVAWLVLAIAGLAAARALPGHLTAITTVPGSPSESAQALLAEHFNENLEGTFTVIVPFGEADDPAIDAMKQRLAQAVRVVPTAEVIQQRAVGGVLVALVGSKLDLLAASAATDDLRTALRSAALPGVMVTGPPALEHDVRPVLADDLRIGTAAALVVMLALLVLALGWSWVVLLPFLVAGAVVATTLLLVLGVALRVPMVLYIPNIVELIGLGLAVDYALLIVHRHRLERAHTTDPDEALRATMRAAGGTVIVAGITAAVGISVLFLLPVPFVRSLGLAGVLVPLVSVAAALTLQPALLSLGGTRFLQAHRWHGLLHDDRMTRRWAALAASIRQWPVRMFAASLALLLACAVPLVGLRLAPASLTAIPGDLESARAVTYVSERVGPGAITPHTVFIDTGADGAARAPQAEKARIALADTISRLPGVLAAVTDTTSLFIDPTDRYQRIVVLGRADFADDGARVLVEQLRALDPAKAGYAAGAQIAVGGAPAQGYDFLQRVLGAIPWLVLASLLVAFVVLARAFRSWLLPAAAVALNLASVAAAIGIVVLVFHYGVGASLLHTQPVPRIEGWSLVFLFAMLFGLSMDYQVFLLSRIREARAQGLSHVDAVVEGLAGTAGLITTAALVLVGALGGLVFGHITGLQELGVGLAAGVLIDATIVRSVLLPATLIMLGRRLP